MQIRHAPALSGSRAEKIHGVADVHGQRLDLGVNGVKFLPPGVGVFPRDPALGARCLEP
jgi:hypothetical protein